MKKGGNRFCVMFILQLNFCRQAKETSVCLVSEDSEQYFVSGVRSYLLHLRLAVAVYQVFQIFHHVRNCCSVEC